jgi:hypothetical protein
MHYFDSFQNLTQSKNYYLTLLHLGIGSIYGSYVSVRVPVIPLQLHGYF